MTKQGGQRRVHDHESLSEAEYEALRKKLGERWGWSVHAPPLPGRIADRLFDIAEELRGVKGAEAALEQLDSLRASLDIWTSEPPK